MHDALHHNSNYMYINRYSKDMNSNKKNKMNSVSNYNGSQKILLVGEGDFSFSLCLAKSFGSATNMTATSLDSREEVERKYMKGKANLEELERLGCTLVHGVNVHSLTADLSHLGWTIYDRIIFNFPHAGFFSGRERDSSIISEHQKVVRGFLRNANKMVKCSSGEIHVTHKTGYPFNEWEIKTLAEEEDLSFVRELDFYEYLFPGYSNKRGSGNNCDDSFRVGNASTFIFIDPN